MLEVLGIAPPAAIDGVVQRPLEGTSFVYTFAGAEAPVILDIATSLASNGAIRTHELEGRPMPEGWVQSRDDGSPITDARRINEGTYLPMGGYKGSGLSIVIGLLAGLLNGAAFGRDIRDFAATAGGATNVGQFVIALDIARFVAPEMASNAPPTPSVTLAFNSPKCSFSQTSPLGVPIAAYRRSGANALAAATIRADSSALNSS